MANLITAPFIGGGAFPVDARMEKTKAEMLATNDNVMPDNYMAMCKDDGQFYLYNKANTLDPGTGKYRVFKGGGSPQYYEMPDPSADLVGTIVQYVGEPVIPYINGYFYQCVEVPEITPKIYTWEQIDVQPNGSIDAYTKEETDALLDEKASLNIAEISTAGGGKEVHATLSQGEDEASVNYYKTTELPDTLNLNIGPDSFRVPATGYVDKKIDDVAGTVPFIANYGQTTYADVTAAIDADKAIVVNFSNNKNLICVTYATYAAGQNVTMSGVYKADSDVSLVTITLTPENAWSIAHTGMQEKLVSGTNIKTINNQSVVGSGNVNVGVNFQVGVEIWYGTYTDENGVTYQVYTKTIYIPALPATPGITTYPHGISGIKQILSVYGFTTDGFVLNAPRQNVQDNIAIFQASKSASNQTISIEVGKDRSSKKAYVTLIYAKNN